MRRALLAAWLLLLPAPAWAVIAEVGSGSQRANSGDVSNTDTFVVAFPANVASGSLVVGLCGFWRSAAITAVAASDTRGTSYTTIIGASTVAWAGGLGHLVLVYGLTPTPGANTVTIDPTGTDNYGRCVINEYSGVDTGTPLDVAWSDSASGGASMAPADALTVATTGALVLGVAVDDAGGTWSATGLLDSSADTGNQPYGASQQLGVSAGAASATFGVTISANWAAGSIAFRPSGVAAAGVSSRLSLLGVGR